MAKPKNAPGPSDRLVVREECARKDVADLEDRPSSSPWPSRRTRQGPRIAWSSARSAPGRTWPTWRTGRHLHHGQAEERARALGSPGRPRGVRPEGRGRPGGPAVIFTMAKPKNAPGPSDRLVVREECARKD